MERSGIGFGIVTHVIWVLFYSFNIKVNSVVILLMCTASNRECIIVADSDAEAVTDVKPLSKAIPL